MEKYEGPALLILAPDTPEPLAMQGLHICCMVPLRYLYGSLGKAFGFDYEALFPSAADFLIGMLRFHSAAEINAQYCTQMEALDTFGIADTGIGVIQVNFARRIRFHLTPGYELKGGVGSLGMLKNPSNIVTFWRLVICKCFSPPQVVNGKGSHYNMMQALGSLSHWCQTCTDVTDDT